MIHLPEFPHYMKEASRRQKGQNWFIELLIFFLVYFHIMRKNELPR